MDLAARGHNLDSLEKGFSSRKGVLAVIKANAYGHGAIAIGRYLEKRPDVSGYAVATAEEALALREAGIQKLILILGPVFPEDYEALIREEVRLCAFREEMLTELEEAAGKVGQKARIHVPVDTGMGRIGVFPDERGVRFVETALKAKNIEVEGVFSHFARADERDKQSAIAQFHCFQSFLKAVKEKTGFTFPIEHLTNSAAMMEFPEASFDWGRAGIAMYGLYPSEELRTAPEKIRQEAFLKKGEGIWPVLQWKACISHVKTVPEGTPISYGGTFVSDKEMRVATIPVGYADGYPRSLSGKGYVLIAGKRARILGRVCMDQFMADVSEIPDAAPGCVATLLGRDGEEAITAEDLGSLSGRFNYELVSLITGRVFREYRGFE